MSKNVLCLMEHNIKTKSKPSLIFFLEVGLCGKLNVNFHSVVMKDTTCTVRLLAKFEFPVRASNKTRLNYSYNKRLLNLNWLWRTHPAMAWPVRQSPKALAISGRDKGLLMQPSICDLRIYTPESWDLGYKYLGYYCSAISKSTSPPVAVYFSVKLCRPISVIIWWFIVY